MRKQIIFVGAIFSLLLLSAILVFSLNSQNIASTTDTEGAINYHSLVCTWINYSNGTIRDNGCSENLLTTNGKNAIRDALTSSNGVAFNYIGLCNATACTSGAASCCNGTNADDAGLYNEFPAGATGLNRTNAATLLFTGTGNWSYSRTFVAGADNMVTNKTGIFNASSGNWVMLAVNTFTTSTLQTNDQITVNWTIWVS